MKHGKIRAMIKNIDQKLLDSDGLCDRSMLMVSGFPTISETEIQGPDRFSATAILLLQWLMELKQNHCTLSFSSFQRWEASKTEE